METRFGTESRDMYFAKYNIDNTDLRSALIQYAIDNKYIGVKYIDENKHTRKRKIKIAETDGEEELWVLDSSWNNSDIKRKRYKSGISLNSVIPYGRIAILDNEDNRYNIDEAIALLEQYLPEQKNSLKNEEDSEKEELSEDKSETGKEFTEQELEKMFNCKVKDLPKNVHNVNPIIQSNIQSELNQLSRAVSENNRLSQSDSNIVEKDNFRGCEKCNYTKYIEIDGIKTVCSCVAKHKTDIANGVEKKSAKLDIKIADVDIMYSVIPEDRRKDEFSAERVKDTVAEMLKNQGFKVVNYDAYMNTLNSILAEIATYGLSNSYILGAPNSFGKTTFVYTAIKRLIAKHKKVVPYLSLTELSELKIEYKEDLLNRAIQSDKGKVDNKKDIKEYKWLDYLNCDVLFTYLSSEEFKEVESKTLYTLLKSRGIKNKPTIVMTSQSLKWYTNDDKLNERYWSDMISFRKETAGVSMDRLVPIYCYKKAINYMALKKGVEY
jgi:hypothetical protein